MITLFVDIFFVCRTGKGKQTFVIAELKKFFKLIVQFNTSRRILCFGISLSNHLHSITVCQVTKGLKWDNSYCWHKIGKITLGKKIKVSAVSGS